MLFWTAALRRSVQRLLVDVTETTTGKRPPRRDRTLKARRRDQPTQGQADSSPPYHATASSRTKVPLPNRPGHQVRLLIALSTPC